MKKIAFFALPIFLLLSFSNCFSGIVLFSGDVLKEHKIVKVEGINFHVFKTDKFAYIIPDDPKKKKKKWVYPELLKIDKNIAIGMGFYYGVAHFPDETFLTSRDGVEGYFGALYDDGPTNTINTNFYMSPTIEVRLFDRLKIGTGSDAFLGKKEDDSGNITYRKDSNGYWITEYNGERRSFASNETEGSLLDLITQSAHSYAELDIVMVPLNNVTGVLFSPGVFRSRVATSHYAGLVEISEFRTTFEDRGFRLTLQIVNDGIVVPARLTTHLGVNGTGNIKIGFNF